MKIVKLTSLSKNYEDLFVRRFSNYELTTKILIPWWTFNVIVCK